MPEQQLPEFEAPEGGRLTADMVSAYDKAGVIILKNFVPVDECSALRRQASTLIEAFDPAEVKSVFSTTKQTQLDDRYFIESGDKIRFFLEDDAFNEAGELRQPKDESLNKMGHAMHDLDPVFRTFLAHTGARSNRGQSRF